MQIQNLTELLNYKSKADLGQRRNDTVKYKGIIHLRKYILMKKKRSPEVADPVRETVVGQPRALRFVHMGRCRDALCQTCRQMGHSFRKLHRHRLQTNQRFVPSLVTVWSSCENIDRNWTSSRPSGLSL